MASEAIWRPYRLEQLLCRCRSNFSLLSLTREINCYHSKSLKFIWRGEKKVKEKAEKANSEVKGE